MSISLLPFSLSSPLWLLLLTFLTGCLPSSCRREEARALFPSDSLSRQVAAQVPVDTLRLLWQHTGPESREMVHPRTVQFGPEGRLYVADTERNSLFVYTASGRFLEEITSPDFAYPYLAGQRGDTLLVFSPGAGRIDFIVNGTVAHSLPTPEAEGGPLQYAAASGSAIYYKVIREGAPGYIARLDSEGNVIERFDLAGPHWRYAGLLHLWGDSLLSLSGFRPVVDVIPPGGPLDTLALRGFDSPMLARSRAFVLGSIDEPPLLSASAAAAGPLLFVLNMRPGWLRVDAYDHTGRLQHILTEANPGLKKQFYPVDLAARRLPDGSYLLAVLFANPQPQLALFAWARRP